MNHMNTELSDMSAMSAGDGAAAAMPPGMVQVLAPAQDAAALHRANQMMAELFVAALGIDQEVRFSGTPAWTLLCRTMSFGMALDLLELCRLRELGAREDRNDPHFMADKIGALVRQVNDIAKYSSRTAPVIGWPLEDLFYALAELLGAEETQTAMRFGIDHIRMPPMHAHVVSLVALRLFLAILRRRYEVRAVGPIGVSVTKAGNEVTLVVSDHAYRGAPAAQSVHQGLIRFGGSIEASFLCRHADEHTESVTMRFTLPTLK
jgi:hypothetical protein